MIKRLLTIGLYSFKTKRKKRTSRRDKGCDPKWPKTKRKKQNVPTAETKFATQITLANKIAVQK